jgi:transposase-like protein
MRDVPAGTSARIEGGGHAIAPAVREAIVLMSATGASQRAIAERHGVDQGTVSRVLAAERRQAA